MDWAEMAPDWVANETALEAAFAPVLHRMLDLADLRSGEKVLDIGFGMGDSIMAALDRVGPRGEVSGVDIAPAMVERAKARVAGRAELYVLDAEQDAMPVTQANLVISKFGSMFFQDRARAFGNIKTALGDDGRMCLAAWGAKGDNPWFRIPARVAQGRLGKATGMVPNAPGPFGFEDPAPVLDMLQAAGWRDVAVQTETLDLTPQGRAADLARTQMRIGSAVAVMGVLGASDADRDAIERGMADGFAGFETAEGLRVPAQIHFFSARR